MGNALGSRCPSTLSFPLPIAMFDTKGRSRKGVTLFVRIQSCFRVKFPGGRGVLGIWADTYARFKVLSTHPSIYQNFLLKPIHLPKFLPFFALEPIYLAKFDTQTHPSTNFMPIFALEPISLPKFGVQTHQSAKISQFLGKMTHPSTYISLSKPTHLHRSYVSMKICKYPPPSGVKFLLLESPRGKVVPPEQQFFKKMRIPAEYSQSHPLI